MQESVISKELEILFQYHSSCTLAKIALHITFFCLASILSHRYLCLFIYSNALALILSPTDRYLSGPVILSKHICTLKRVLIFWSNTHTTLYQTKDRKDNFKLFIFKIKSISKTLNYFTLASLKIIDHTIFNNINQIY